MSTQLTVSPQSEAPTGTETGTEEKCEEGPAASDSEALTEGEAGPVDKSPVIIPHDDGLAFCERPKATFSANLPASGVVTTQARSGLRRGRETTTDQVNPSLVLPRLWSIDVSMTVF